MARLRSQPGEHSAGATPLTSLPAGLYTDPAFIEVERRHLFAKSWHLICHLNDVPNAGDYHTLDILGERFVAIRASDGVVRSFHNVCRHRGSRLAGLSSGNCGHRLVCPYHAWSYGLDGALEGIPPWQEFDRLDKTQYPLAALEQEIWHGFVFVRMQADGPTVAEMCAPYEDEIGAHRFEDLRPQGRVTLRPRPVNWKNISDNYGDGLHIPVAHPGLRRLFAGSYRLEAKPWIDKMEGSISETPSPNWSERRYQALLGEFDHLPAERRRTWSYYRLWPNVAFDVYPDQVDFMQLLPVSATETLIREIAYALPDNRREAGAARYLNWRINRQVNAEDTKLLIGVQQGMTSSSYSSGPLSSSEVCLSAFARRFRAAVPAGAIEACQ